MKITKGMESQSISMELSNRCKQYRIACSLTQAELADKSLVSLSTIKRFESGEDISLSKLIMLLKALDLAENLEMLIPDQSNRPSAYLDTAKMKQRVRNRKKKEKKDWKWGDEE